MSRPGRRRHTALAVSAGRTGEPDTPPVAAVCHDRSARAGNRERTTRLIRELRYERAATNPVDPAFPSGQPIVDGYNAVIGEIESQGDRRTPIRRHRLAMTDKALPAGIHHLLETVTHAFALMAIGTILYRLLA